jgi:hypothetical protein
MKKLDKTPAEVTEFLKDFNIKISIFDIIVLASRIENITTLAELGITEAQRKAVLQELITTDFSEAGVEEFGVYGTEMWIFGKIIKGREIYIKITLGNLNSRVICISFHFAKYVMKYPFKTK